MHIAFYLAINRIFGAVFTSAILPALALVAKLPGRNDMFPFNAAGAVFVFTHLIAAGLKVNDPFFTLPVNFTAAVEIARHIGVHLHACCLGLGKTVDTIGQSMA